MAFGLLLPMRIAQFLFAIVVVGLSAYGTHLSLLCSGKYDLTLNV